MSDQFKALGHFAMAVGQLMFGQRNDEEANQDSQRRGPRKKFKREDAKSFGDRSPGDADSCCTKRRKRNVPSL